MTTNNRWLRKQTVHGLLILLCSLALWACSPGGGVSGKHKTDDSVHGTYNTTAKALIGSYTGGAITVETPDGIQVTVDIPAGAMEYSREITLSVSDERLTDTDPSFSIAIEPAVALMERAQLTVLFPEEIGGNNMVLCRNATTVMPLKQEQETRVLVASLYRLGEFSCAVPEVGGMVTAAYDLMAKDPTGSWQDTYASFDALLWLADYLNTAGLNRESGECFRATAVMSVDQVERFIASVGPIEKGGGDFRALVKFKRLMALCENPQDINQSLDDLMAEVQ